MSTSTMSAYFADLEKQFAIDVICRTRWVKCLHGEACDIIREIFRFRNTITEYFVIVVKQAEIFIVWDAAHEVTSNKWQTQLWLMIEVFVVRFT